MPTTLTNAVLVDFDPPRVRAGAVRVVDDQIVKVGEGVVPESGDEVVDCDGAVVVPGLVNGHTHLYSALAIGMPPPAQAPENFHQILQRVWWRLDRAHDEASVRASGQVGALAALRCGTTTLIDHHASPSCIEGSLSILRDGIADVGCRGVLCYETTDRNGATGAQQGLLENKRFAAECRDADSAFAALVGAHASFTLEDETLAECVALCREEGVGLHIHVAEDPVDDRETMVHYGANLVERLERFGVLQLPGSILAHGTHLSPEAIQTITAADSGLVIAHNPSSNMNNGVGYTPVASFSSPPLLGTDGIGADLWREARTAFFKSNDAGKPIVLQRPLEMLAASARFASSALGCSMGQLEVGAKADLVVTSYVPATPLDGETFAAHLVFGMGPEYVRHVMIDGVWRLRQQTLVDGDESQWRAAARETARHLFARL